MDHSPVTNTVSAPGSLMLLGEHAVLHDRRALVCAINQQIRISISPRKDNGIQIESEIGDYCGQLDDLNPDPKFDFMLDAITGYRSRLKTGLDLRVESDFSSQIGFGSSAAITAATHAGLMRATGEWSGKSGRKFKLDLFQRALETIHAIQGSGSGSDLAASVFGGLLAYRAKPFQIDQFRISHPLTAVYCGYKRKTAEVIRLLEDEYRKDLEKYSALFDKMDRSVREATQKLSASDWEGLGALLNKNQILMEEMGLSTPELDEIIAALQGDSHILGAKISGSGLGDCAVGLGAAKLGNDFSYSVYPLEISRSGIRLD